MKRLLAALLPLMLVASSASAGGTSDHSDVRIAKTGFVLAPEWPLLAHTWPVAIGPLESDLGRRSGSRAKVPLAHTIPISVGTSYRASPAASGNMVVWLQSRPGLQKNGIPLGDVYGKNLLTGRRFRVTGRSTAVTALPASEGLAGQVTASGNIVTWLDCRHCHSAHGLPGVAGWEIYARDLTAGHTVRLVGAGSAAVSGRTVIWSECCGARQQLYGMDMSAGRAFVVANSRHAKTAPSISGGLVVWLEQAQDGWEVRGKALRTGKSFIVARPHGDEYLSDPRASGTMVIWTRRGLPDGSVLIEGRDLRHGKYTQVARIPGEHYVPWSGPNAAISGTIVVWDQAQHDWSRDDFEVLGKDIRTGQTYRIATTNRDEIRPSISGKLVVWQSVFHKGSAGRAIESDVEGVMLR